MGAFASSLNSIKIGKRIPCRIKEMLPKEYGKSKGIDKKIKEVCSSVNTFCNCFKNRLLICANLSGTQEMPWT